MQIFSLNDIKIEKVRLNNSSSSAWESQIDFGYYGLAAAATSPVYGTSSSVFRIDFSSYTESELPSTSVTYPTITSQGGYSFENSYYGYYGGGYNPTNPGRYNPIARLDFGTDTVDNSGGGNPRGAAFQACLNSETIAYTFGGDAVPAFPKSTESYITRLDFSSGAALATTLITGSNAFLYRQQSRGTSSTDLSLGIGYVIGGNSPTVPSAFGSINRVDMATESFDDGELLLLSGNANRRFGIAENRFYGYLGGGINPSPPASYYSSIQRFDFDTTTVNLLSSNLSAQRYDINTISDNVYGYFVGSRWYPGTPVTHYSNTDRLDFSTDTVTFNYGPGGKANSSFESRSSTSTKNNKNNNIEGHFAGGDSASIIISTIDRLDFFTETVTNPTSIKLPTPNSDLAAISSGYYGYFGGGYFFPPSTYYSTINRLDFFVGKIQTLQSNLSSSKSSLTSTASSSYGYFIGGKTPTEISTIDRIDFSNEVVSTPTSKLSLEKSSLAAVSSVSYGYFAGGTPPPSISTIDRMDFSNESISTPTTTLSTTNYRLAAVSNDFYGYFAGGFTPLSFVSIIDRIDFSNETLTTIPANLSSNRGDFASTSNSFYGYFAGGFTNTPTPASLSTIDRLDFSTEIVATPTPKLSTAKYKLCGVSNFK